MSSSKEENPTVAGSQPRSGGQEEVEEEGTTETTTLPTEITLPTVDPNSSAGPKPGDEKTVIEILVEQGNIAPCVDDNSEQAKHDEVRDKKLTPEEDKGQQPIAVGVAMAPPSPPNLQEPNDGLKSSQSTGKPAGTTGSTATDLADPTATESAPKNAVPTPPTLHRSAVHHPEATPGAFALVPARSGNGGTNAFVVAAGDNSSSNEGERAVVEQATANATGSSGVNTNISTDGEAAVERVNPAAGENLIEARAVDDVVEVQAKPIEWWTPQKTCWMIVGTLTVLIIIIAVAVSVVVRNQNNNNKDNETSAPTLPPEERLWVITNVLLTEAYSDNYTDTARRLLEDPESPQYQALQWIALDDKFRVPSDDVQHLIQRYALGVLFYSTSGETWMESFEFLDPDHECSWSGALTCSSGDGETVTGIALPENALVGRLPAEELGFLRDQLQSLDLATNEITGTLPPAMTQLTHLNLGRNGFTGTIPDEYQSMVMLEHMDMKMNLLNGTIPQQFGALTKLTTLDIESNYLTGTIPDSMWDLTSLDKFIIESQVELGGTISPKVGRWENVTVFLVNMNNGLTGSIPTEVGLLTNLVEFKTAQNHMRGTIPTEMGLLTNLKFLAFSRNGYNGTLPSELAGLTNLHQMYIQSTWITGEMVEFCEAKENGQLPMLKTLIADQQEVNCTCCTCCLY